MHCLKYKSPVLAALLFLFIFETEAHATIQILATESDHQIAQATFPTVDSILKQYSIYTISSRIPLAKATAGPFRNGGSLRLQLGSRYDLTFQLFPSDQRSADYRIRILTDTGILDRQGTECRSYRGYRSGKKEEKARFTIDGNSIAGFFTWGSETIYLEPLLNFDKAADSASLLAYRGSDLLEKNTGFCLTNDSNVVSHGMEKRTAGTEYNDPCVTADLCLAADVSMVKQYGSVAAVEKRLLTIHNMVAERFSDPRLNIIHRIVEIVIDSTEHETFGRTDDWDAAGFVEWVNGPEGFSSESDVAGLFFHDTSSGKIGVARQEGICADSGVHLIKDYTTSLHAMSLLVAHELAHNWGAKHVQTSNSIMFRQVVPGIDGWCESTVSSINQFKRLCNCLDPCEEPPKAEIILSQQTYCTGTIQFRDGSRYSPTSRTWHFGDGNHSNARNPIHSYEKNGSYTISLFVQNQNGADTARETITINALSWPVLNEHMKCFGDTALVTGSSTQEIRWYSSPVGGLPISIGDTFKIALPTSMDTVFAENGSPPKQIVSIGPGDTSAGLSGDYYSNHELLYMAFVTHKPLVLASLDVYSSVKGTQKFYLQEKNDAHTGIWPIGTRPTLQEKIIDLPTGKSTITLDWFIEEPGDYWLCLGNGKKHLNDLYRTKKGISYPQQITDLISIYSNHWRDGIGGPATTGWYIGYNWKIREFDNCGSARMPIPLPRSCKTTVEPKRHSPPKKPYPMIKNGILQLDTEAITGSGNQIRVFNLAGKCLAGHRIPHDKTSRPFSIDLRHLGHQSLIIQFEGGRKGEIYRLLHLR